MSFLRLVHNENVKLYKRKILWIMTGIILAIMSLNIMITMNLSPDRSDNWREQLQQEIQTLKEEAHRDQEFTSLHDFYELEIQMKEYHLNHDIMPIYENTLLGFVKSSIALTGIINLFVIVISSSIVSQEYSWKTLKLLLLRPVQRYKLVLAKYVAILFNAAVILLCLTILAFAIGSIWFGWKDVSLRYVYMVSGEIKDMSFFTYLIKYLGSKFISMAMIAAFALMISTIFKNNALAITLAIVLQSAGSFITSLLTLLKLEKVSKYLFFSNTNLYQYVEGTPPEGMSLGFSLGVLAVYFFVFMTVSLVIFQRRDVA